MAENLGYIKLERSLLDSDFYHGLSHSSVRVLIEMLRLANYHESEVIIDGELRTLQPGQILASRKTITKNTKATEREIRTFEARAQLFNFMTKETTKGNRTIYTINTDFLTVEEKKRQRKRQTSDKGATTSKKGEESKEEKEWVIKDIFAHWNSKENLNKHRELTDRIKSAINPKLEYYTKDEIKKAFDNYDFVIGSPNYFWNHKWPLVIFMQRENGFLSFVDESQPLWNFLADKTGVKPNVQEEDELKQQRKADEKRRLRESCRRQNQAHLEWLRLQSEGTPQPRQVLKDSGD